uniref:Uncharacterized protein n=1 Tax=Daphnia galeata TaxID=27404 RepID=A0A8J2S5K9_9CRUS|nr:unnamed protein product [Daphnia galeata]
MTSIGLTRRQKRRKLQTHLAATAGLYDDDLYAESNSNYLGNVLQNANVVPESDFSDHLNNDVYSAEPEQNSEIYDSDLDPLSESDDELYVEDKLEVPDIFYDCEFQDDSENFFIVKKNRVWIVTMTLVNVWHPGLYNAKYLNAMLTNY